jgi:hypothetical protein
MHVFIPRSDHMNIGIFPFEFSKNLYGIYKLVASIRQQILFTPQPYWIQNEVKGAAVVYAVQDYMFVVAEKQQTD